MAIAGVHKYAAVRDYVPDTNSSFLIAYVLVMPLRDHSLKASIGRVGASSQCRSVVRSGFYYQWLIPVPCCSANTKRVGVPLLEKGLSRYLSFAMAPAL